MTNKKMQSFWAVILIILLNQSYLFSQNILNGGFETNVFDNSCRFGMMNSQYNSLISNISAYGTVPGNDIIHDGSCPTIGQANSGSWNGTLEYLNDWFSLTGNTALSFELSSTVTSGNQYTLTFHDKAVILNSDYIIGTLSIGISQNQTSNGINIGTFTPVQGVWTQRSITFSAPFSGTAYITATVLAHNEMGKVAWVHIDDFTFEVFLPVELRSFNCKLIHNEVILNWTTSSELNNSGFEIQHSNNGAEWSEIGFIEGKGTSVEENAYEFIDKNPIFGTNYYRLKQIDFDGAFEFSKVIAVEHNNSEKNIQVFPNPSNRLINIQIGSLANQRIKVEIIDNLGRKVWGSGLIKIESDWRKEIAIERNGIYFISAQIGDEIFNRRILINNHN